MTVGEIIDWIESAVERVRAQSEQIKLQAWYNGLTCRLAVVAAMNTEATYPTYAELFPDTEPKTPEQIAQQDENEWRTHRATLKKAIDTAAAEAERG